MRSVFVVSLASTRKVNLIQDASQPQKQSDSRGKRTNSPCPPDSLRGICYLLKKLLLLAIPPVLVAGEKSGNTGNTDTHLRGSPPSIVVEPGLLTPAMARTNGPGGTRRRFCLRQSLRQWKRLNILPSPVGNPAATKRAPCHIHPSHRPKKDRLTRKCRSLGQETADYTHPTSPVAFGPWCQALLSQSTGLTIGLVGQVHGSLSEFILLTDFTQPEASPGGTAQFPIILPYKSLAGNWFIPRDAQRAVSK